MKSVNYFTKAAVKTIIKAAAICTMTVCIAFASFLNLRAEDCTSWYVMRNQKHIQPKLESYFSYIEKYKCYYVDENHKDISPDSEKVIYLTFDAGYENGNIEKILDVLKKHNATSAFFILENLINRNPELVQRMKDEGQLVCNHTATHKDMSKCTDKNEFFAELERLENAYRELTGEEIAKYYRPPEGKLTECNLKFAEEIGYSTVLWSFAYADWDNNKQPSKTDAMKKIMDNIHNGEIMLLHPTSSTNAEILDELMTKLENEGFRFGSLTELG